MGYRSDIRITTTKKGYDKFRKIVKDKTKNGDDNLLDYLDVMFVNSKGVLIGWDDIKWYDSDTSSMVKNIMDSLDELEDNDITYNYARMGESPDDYDEKYYISETDKDYIPCPSIVRTFDDEYVKEQLSENYKKQKNSENEVSM